MILKLRHHFDSAHRLMDYKGRANNIHGHTWKVNVTIYFNDKGNKYIAFDKNNNGMIVGFGDIKKIIDEFDHKLILREDDPLITMVNDHTEIIILEKNATAEYLSRIIHDKICDMLDDKSNINLVDKINVVVFESDNASVMW